jgi:hypothetical protein
MSYDCRRNLGACKSNYIAIQSCFGYTGLILQAEEQMLDWQCFLALGGTLHTVYNGNSLGGSRRPRELLSWIPNTVDSLISLSWADLHITRLPVSCRQLGLLANHRIQQKVHRERNLPFCRAGKRARSPSAWQKRDSCRFLLVGGFPSVAETLEISKPRDGRRGATPNFVLLYRRGLHETTPLKPRHVPSAACPFPSTTGLR